MFIYIFLLHHVLSNFIFSLIVNKIVHSIAEQSLRENNGVSEGGRLENSTNQPVLLNQEREHSNRACLEHGICSHEVLQDAEDVDSNMVNNKIMKKVSFVIIVVITIIVVRCVFMCLRYWLWISLGLRYLGL